jgi:hypothetical protein
MQRHRYSFFGKKVGLLLDSGDWNHPNIYFRFIKKKNSGDWEKPSAKEGKTLKFSLLELISIINTLEQPGSKWSTVHRFQGDSTPITFKHKGNHMMIFLQNYHKYLNDAEIALITALLKHIFQEKIQYATGNKISDQNKIPNSNSNRPSVSNKINNKQTHSSIGNFSNKISRNVQNKGNLQRKKLGQSSSLDKNIQINKNEYSNKIGTISTSRQDYSQYKDSNQEIQTRSRAKEWLNSLESKEDCYLLPGHIEARSQKAVAFQIKNFNSTWIPISCVKQAHSSSVNKGLWVKKWFVQKRVQDIIA